MKKSLLLLLLLLSTQLFSQTIPCDFSWNNAPTTGGNRDFVTSARAQIDQGPCLSFAFNAAIETMYGIENSVYGSSLFSLSDAYLDYKVWNAPNYLPILNSSFKIPLAVAGGEINAFAPQTCPVNNPDINGCSIPRGSVLAYINHANGQRSYRIFLDTNFSPPVWAVDDGGALGNYVTVGNATQLSTSDINSVNDIKTKILNNGPIVVKVSGIQNGVHDAKKFRNYNIPAAGLSYHAFTIIGWTSDSRWVIKDSWRGMSGIVNTNQNVDIVGLMNSGSVELYQVSGISYNGNNTSTNPTVLSVNECIPTINLTLSSISLDIDYAHIGGYLYHKFWVSSNIPVDRWVWGIDYPNGSLKRSQVDNSDSSSILMSPTTSGLVTVYVRAYKNGQTVTKERRIHLSNGQSSGGGPENGW
ncbi:hypothetical protein ATO12_14590 [Aquimarina atlantica]|uniref:Peptidase C1A papain C-terminal domain-containing protein n=1 Tax=Aquimarina atlantica TaxID=1317122 RepID=A0A023BW00_9FLAO|nr:hypothetical protein [Aquimarina atlantica]EZH74099.1 hypothetical protein ATO12_14590 [Aquimarina atlantica]